MRTQGSDLRCAASWSRRRLRSFSQPRSSRRAASHSPREPMVGAVTVCDRGTRPTLRWGSRPAGAGTSGPKRPGRSSAMTIVRLASSAASGESSGSADGWPVAVARSQVWVAVSRRLMLARARPGIGPGPASTIRSSTPGARQPTIAPVAAVVELGRGVGAEGEGLGRSSGRRRRRGRSTTPIMCSSRSRTVHSVHGVLSSYWSGRTPATTSWAWAKVRSRASMRSITAFRSV